jgi:hypothetical protein
MELDLDINNYDFEDLKNLFNISEQFTEFELKNAYKQVLKTHPDKSGLDKEYFLFFSKAFKLLKQIYDYSHKKEECIKRQVYNNEQEEDKNIKQIVNKNKNVKEFNKKFNEIFEKVKIEDGEQDNGYDEWFRSNNDMIETKATNVRDMNNEIEELKSRNRERALIVHNGIQDLAYNSGSYNLIREKPQEYSSDVFSKLQYEDLKKAHTETVVPVTEEDYRNRKHFNNTNDLLVYRKQNEQLLSEDESKQLLMNNKSKEQSENLNNAYKMMKQMEKIEESHKQWKAHFKLLTN